VPPTNRENGRPVNKRRQVQKNAILTIVQVIVSAMFLFFVYKFLLHEIGPERMGVWSIVMAVSTLARISDLGFAGGMTRFVAKYRAHDNHEAVLEVVETGTLSLLALAVGIVGLFWPLFSLVLPFFIAGPPLKDALDLLPFSLASFAMMAVAGGYLSTLDGLNRADLRNLILIAATLIHGVAIPLCVRNLGFVGLGWAQLGQSGLIMLGGWAMTHRELGVGLLPRRWRRARFREMLGYNVSLQVSSLASFLGDPLTKLMLGHYGSLAAVGYYEMATKMVNQFRAIVINVNQIMVPIITHMHESNIAGVNRLFGDMYRLLLYVSILFYGAAAMFVPLIALLWIGEPQHFFIAVSYVMLVTMFFNTIIAPAYFVNLGVGRADLNALSQLIIGLGNLTGAMIFGAYFGAAGVVGAYAFAVLCGSGFVMQRFLNLQDLPAGILLGGGIWRMGLFVALLVGLEASLAHLRPDMPTNISLAILGGAGIALVGWRAPERRLMYELLRRRPPAVSQNEFP
jgi:O-antigen/teichoic acid export membrane protein